MLDSALLKDIFPFQWRRKMIQEGGGGASELRGAQKVMQFGLHLWVVLQFWEGSSPPPPIPTLMLFMKICSFKACL